jgi:VWFA-related protein
VVASVHTNGALLALVLAARAVVAATDSSAPPTLTRSHEITVELEAPTPPPSLDPTSFEILLRGQATRLHSARRAPLPWQIVVYFDANLATREGLAAAARALTGVSRQLVQLGEVDVVSANPWPEALAENERDAVALSDALSWVSDEAESASEIVITREEFLESRKAGRDGPEIGAQASRHELQLLAASREALLGWLSLQSRRGPRCLILVQDGFDLKTREFYSAAGAQEHEFEALSRDLAADGWTVLPLTLAKRPAVLSATPEALHELAEATGGRVVASPTELDAAIEALANRWQLTFEVSGPAAADPRPLEVRPSRSDWAIRGPRWGSIAPPLSFSQARARWMIEEPDWIEQGLPTQSVLLLDRQVSTSSDPAMATIEALMLLPGGRNSGPTSPFRISVLLATLAGETAVTTENTQPDDLSRAQAWHYRRRLEIPPDTAEAVVVIEDLGSGLWGAANVEVGGPPLSAEGLQVVEHREAREIAPGGAETGSQRDVVVRLLPPRRRPATGRLRFDTLISNSAVRRVDFYLDGELVDSDERPPFAATLDLGSEPDAHAVKAVAYGRAEAPLGEHAIVVNPGRGSFAVLISEMTTGGQADELQIEAEVGIPPGETIDRVEFYRNESLVARLEQPPWRARLPGGEPGSADYVRVAAYLANGESMEDARLLSSSGVEERVEVNLVELNVVVTDREDAPVRGLKPENFAVFFRGRPHEVQRFSLAEEIPLVLGLVVDTSESMMTLMVETKKAGAQFLGETLREGDQAFLVDFDTRPRLAREATDDFVALLRQFNSLQPEGFTALYDAIIFSLLQFEEATGRKALVLLTDGDDYRSKYGPRRCIQYGRQLGVPVYIISLGALQSPRRGFRRIDLEGITEGTGGKVFYITEMSELSDAYAQINDELRSQYVLAFATDGPLADEDLSAIEVKVTDKELAVRSVVGGQQLD